MKKNQLKKLYKGNPPAEGVVLASYEGWDLYETQQNGKWLNFKLVHAKPIEHKANYWLGFGVNGTAPRTPEWKKLATRPELHAWALQQLTAISGRKRQTTEG
jgi:hypothetical protein